MPISNPTELFTRPGPSDEERLRSLENTRRIWPVYSLATAPVAGQAVADGITIGVTLASFAELWHSRLPVLAGPLLDVGMYVFLVAGTQAEIRVRIDHPDGAVYSSTLLTAVGVDAFRAVTANWLHDQRLWVGPIVITLEARLVAGSPVLWIYQPTRWLVRDPELGTSGPDWSDELL